MVWTLNPSSQEAGNLLGLRCQSSLYNEFQASQSYTGGRKGRGERVTGLVVDGTIRLFGNLGKVEDYLFSKELGAGKRAQQVKVLAVEPEELSLTPGTYKEPTSFSYYDMSACTDTQNKIFKNV